MKKTLLLWIAYACFLTFSVNAQQVPSPDNFIEKTLLFNRLPGKFAIDHFLLGKIFGLAVHSKIIIPVSGSQYFEGSVMDKVQKNSHVLSVNIKTSNFDGALLNLSRIVYDENTVMYIGRIINIRYGDAFVLRKENNEFLFFKEKQSLIVTE